VNSKKKFPLLIFFVIWVVSFWVWFDKVSEKERPMRADVLAEIHRRIEEIDEIAKKTDSPELFASAKPAISGLTFIGTPAAPYLLKEALNKERNTLSRMVYIQILAGIENKKSVPYLINILMDGKEDERLRMQTASALGILNDERAIPPLKEALSDENKRIAEISRLALRNFGEE
jgi:HEAT repeat protein